MVEPRTCGQLYLAAIISVWIYYTFWILITPVIDEDHPI
jgi:hypothetical protein